MVERHVEEIEMVFSSFLYFEDGEVVYEFDGDAHSYRLRDSRPPTARELEDIYGVVPEENNG